ncbi:hypothetical protein F2Q70_00008810 [Brassica cretica]|uniref:Large ribosomal subunit protein uL2 C-terminal domain-containing protein n=1 Tax=Brassica cretica TaxID=69181 RepID=A0A8S9MDE6_BRACR|nr:hypothetical protein F2Q70_00008810 [Brassica cretica]
MSALVALCRARTAASSSLLNSLVRPAFRSLSTGFGDVQNKTLVAEMEEKMLHMDINSMIGSSMPLGMMRIGTIIHNIEMNPGQGAKLVRAAGTNAKILKEPASGKCLIKLPSGDTRWINARCRATIGTVSNPSHGVKKLYKAGQSSHGRTGWSEPESLGIRHGLVTLNPLVPRLSSIRASRVFSSLSLRIKKLFDFASLSALVALCRARTAASSSSSSLLNSLVRPAFRCLSTGFGDVQNKTLVAEMEEKMLHMDINSMIGSSMPLGMMRIGTIIHNIEMNPGQGAKLVRAAGTNAKILKEPASGKCLIKLPSGDTRWINARCRATIGTVSNPSHGVKKLYKAGQSRWLGIRPKVRGVAMNPCDHPHGG